MERTTPDWPVVQTIGQEKGHQGKEFTGNVGSDVNFKLYFVVLFVNVSAVFHSQMFSLNNYVN